MSIPPKARIAPWTNDVTPSVRITSAGIATTSALVSVRIAFAAALRGPAFRAQIATLHPSWARAIAVARPSPWLAAATRATFPRIPRSTMTAIGVPGKKDSAAASFAQEAADFADGLEPERLVHCLWRVEEIRDQYDPFAMGLHRALARLENHRASNAPHPEIRMGRDVVDPREDAPRPEADRPRRCAVQVGHIGPHPHPPRAFPPETP